MGTKKGQAGKLYRIVARSDSGDRHASAFDVMRSEIQEGQVVLTGEVFDLSHLFEVLERIDDLGLQLLGVQALSEEAP